MAFTSYEAMPLDQMLSRVQKYHPGDGYKLVEKAWKFAEKAHEGQNRKSGEPYFIHPRLVASILTDLMIDPPTIAAGLLHDTVVTAQASPWIPSARNSGTRSPTWWMASPN